MRRTGFLTALALVAVACTHQGQQQQAGETMAAGDSVKAQAIEFVADSVVEKTAVADYQGVPRGAAQWQRTARQGRCGVCERGARL